MVKIPVALVVVLSILNSSGATEKVAVLVARATCSGTIVACATCSSASHSSDYTTCLQINTTSVYCTNNVSFSETPTKQSQQYKINLNNISTIQHKYLCYVYVVLLRYCWDLCCIVEIVVLWSFLSIDFIILSNLSHSNFYSWLNLYIQSI